MGADGIQWYGEDHMMRTTREYKYSFLPRRCARSGRLLWMTVAMRERIENEWYDGIEAHVSVDYQWYDSAEALIMLIKGVAE